MKIGIVGLGFVGLSFACVLGAKGYHVIGIDSDEDKLSIIKKGKAPFFEPKLEFMLRKALTKKLTITENIDNVKKCDLIFVTVGTPQSKDGSIDLTMIKSAVSEIGESIKKSKKKHAIIIKSTVVPGTTNEVVLPILEEKSRKKVGIDFGLITNPEFLRESQAIDDTINPHVVVLGGIQNNFFSQLLKFYKKLNAKVPIKQTNSQTAEIIKYANNAFLATKISYINQIANICEKIPGANVEDVAKTIGLDPRIGKLFLNAGPGYGGSCLPKDVRAIMNFSYRNGIKPTLFDAVEKTNDYQIKRLLNLIEDSIGKLKDKKITILGLAFKPTTDDIRDSVSIDLIRQLLKKKASITVNDPKAIENTRKLFKEKIRYEKSIKKSLESSYCGIIMTAWPQYKKINNSMLKTMKNRLIIDTRRILNKNKLNGKYFAIGIGSD